MAIELDTILNSGDIGTIYLGGTDPKNRVVTEEELKNTTSYFKSASNSANVSDANTTQVVKLTAVDLEPGEYHITFTVDSEYTPGGNLYTIFTIGHITEKFHMFGGLASLASQTRVEHFTQATKSDLDIEIDVYGSDFPYIVRGYISIERKA